MIITSIYYEASEIQFEYPQFTTQCNRSTEDVNDPITTGQTECPVDIKTNTKLATSTLLGLHLKRYMHAVFVFRVEKTKLEE